MNVTLVSLYGMQYIICFGSICFAHVMYIACNLGKDKVAIVTGNFC